MPHGQLDVATEDVPEEDLGISLKAPGVVLESPQIETVKGLGSVGSKTG